MNEEMDEAQSRLDSARTLVNKLLKTNSMNFLILHDF